MGSRRICVISFLSTFLISHNALKGAIRSFTSLNLYIPLPACSLSLEKAIGSAELPITSLHQGHNKLRSKTIASVCYDNFQRRVRFEDFRNKFKSNGNLKYFLFNVPTPSFASKRDIGKLTNENKARISESFHSINFHKAFSKMAMPVPQTSKLDPAEIPLVGCTSAKNVDVKVLPRDSYEEFKGDMVIFGVYGLKKEDKKKGDLFKIPKDVLPAEYADVIEEAAINQSFKATTGSVLKLYLPKADKYKQLCLLGMGSPEEFDLPAVSKISTATAKLLCGCKLVKNAAFVFTPIHKKDCSDTPSVCPYLQSKMMTPKTILETFLQTFLVDLQTDTRFKSSEDKEKISTIESLSIYQSMCSKADPEESIKAAKAYAEGVQLARELVNSPANFCNPVSLANVAVEVADNYGLKSRVFSKEEIEEMKMGSYMAVSKGSMFPPRFIHLTYTSPSTEIKKRIAFVGKGVCFDSGGYDLKNAAAQADMKIDMGGAAALLGAATVLGKLKPENIEVHFIIPAGENMVDKASYRPGDIIRAGNDKTIEVGNTDAEGRLMLADALVYADKLGVDAIVDIATLTGACVTALGPDIAACLSDDDELAEKVLKNAKRVGEKLWRLPLETGYRNFLDSPIADINNISTKNKGAGTIVAALFLKEFVEKTPWAHLDIAGPVYDSSSGFASGFGVKTLASLAMDIE